jgi:uncharacterized protein YggE
MWTRNRTLPIAVALVVVALLGAAVMSFAGDDDGGAVAAETDATRTITVSGEGRVSLPPDVVSMQFGVDVLDPELGAAQTAAAERMDAVIAALQAAGVAERDIQTSGYSISVERNYERADQPITGYRVSHTVSAKVRQIDQAGAVIQAAVDAGANNIYGVWFALDDPAEAVRQARERAVADAKARAEELARLTDATLGPVQAVVEGYSPATPYIAGAGYAEDARSAAPTISPGQTEVVVTVTVSYAIS